MLFTFRGGRAFLFLSRPVSLWRPNKTGNVISTRSREESDVLATVCCRQFSQDGEVQKVGILLSNTLNTRSFNLEFLLGCFLLRILYL